MTHCRFCSENPRSTWIEGNATFTIAMSRTTMNCTTLRSPSAHHLRRSEVTMSSISLRVESLDFRLPGAGRATEWSGPANRSTANRTCLSGGGWKNWRPVTIPGITAEEQPGTIEDGEPFVLVDALAPMVYAHSHLPGAINLPPTAVEPTRLARRIPDRETEIVVYCSNPDCNDSVPTARRLEELGYTNVRHYPGGKDEWRAA